MASSWEMDHKELDAKVDSEAQAMLGLLAETSMFCWFPIRTPAEVALLLQVTEGSELSKEEKQKRGQSLISELAPSVFQVGKTSPFSSEHTVYRMFQSDTEVRVYATGKNYARYRLSRASATFGVEIMNEATFITEVAEEWDAMAGLLGEPEPDDEPETPAEKPALSVVPNQG